MPVHMGSTEDRAFYDLRAVIASFACFSESGQYLERLRTVQIIRNFIIDTSLEPIASTHHE